MSEKKSPGSSTYITMITAPPKPPCWRDFIAEGNKDGPTKSIAGNKRKQRRDKFDKTKEKERDTIKEKQSAEFTDISLIDQKDSLVGELEKTNVIPSKLLHQKGSLKTSHQKRPRNKLHRTRSEFSLEQSDLPGAENLAISLAETKPKEFNLRIGQKPPFDDRRYNDENRKRCQLWLAGIKASEPLEDIVFAQGAGVEVEVPEESWEEMDVSVQQLPFETTTEVDDIPPKNEVNMEDDALSNTEANSQKIASSEMQVACTESQSNVSQSVGESDLSYKDSLIVGPPSLSVEPMHVDQEGVVSLDKIRLLEVDSHRVTSFVEKSFCAKT